MPQIRDLSCARRSKRSGTRTSRIKPEPYCPRHGKMKVASTRRDLNTRYFFCEHCGMTGKEVISSAEREFPTE